MKRHINLFYPFLKREKQFPKYYNPSHYLFAHNKIKFKETLFWGVGGGKSWKLNGEIIYVTRGRIPTSSFLNNLNIIFLCPLRTLYWFAVYSKECSLASSSRRLELISLHRNRNAFQNNLFLDDFMHCGVEKQVYRTVSVENQ